MTLISGRPPHLPFRLALAIGIVLAIPLGTSPPALAASPKLTLTAGFDNNYKPGAWTPLVIRIKNYELRPGADRGQIEVQVRTRDGRVDSYTQPVDLTTSDGANPSPITVCYLHPTYDQSPQISARLIVNGRTVAQETLRGAQPALPGTGQVVLVVSDVRETSFTVAGPVNERARWTFIYPEASELPSSACGYQAIDNIAIDAAKLESLTTEQAAALTSWVRTGGLLALLGVPRTPSSGLEALLGPAARHPIGSGTVLRMGAELKGIGLAESLMSAFSQVNRQRNTVLGRLRGSLEPPRDRYYWYEGDSAGLFALSNALTGTQSVDAPSYSLVGLFLLGYILLLVPVNYFVLKRFDRKEMAWLTAPAIIALFSVAAYAQGRAIKGGELTLRTCAILEGTANSSRFESYTLASVYSPGQKRYTLSVGDKDATAVDITQGLQLGAKPQSVQLVRDHRTTVKDASIAMWDQRTFGIGAAADLGGPIQVVSENDAGRAIRLKLTNRSAMMITGCKIQYADRQEVIGKLEPGQTVTVSLRPTVENGTAAVPSPTIPGESSQDMAALRKALSELAANESQTNSSPYAPAGRPNFHEAVLTGWLDGGRTNLVLEGERPKTAGVSCVVVHIPLGRADSKVSAAVRSDQRP